MDPELKISTLMDEADAQDTVFKQECLLGSNVAEAKELQSLTFSLREVWVESGHRALRSSQEMAPTHAQLDEM